MAEQLLVTPISLYNMSLLPMGNQSRQQFQYFSFNYSEIILEGDITSIKVQAMHDMQGKLVSWYLTKHLEEEYSWQMSLVTLHDCSIISTLPYLTNA